MGVEYLHQYLENSAAQYPHNNALICGEESLSYEELKIKVSDLSASIKSNEGFAIGCRIGICAPKSISTVIGIFGVLKAGCGYVPVGHDMPVDRNGYIFDQCGVHHILLHSSCMELLKYWDETSVEVRPINLDGFVWVTLLRESNENKQDLAYILYTSGSTGRPKGVTFTHDQAISFVEWCGSVFDAGPNSVFSSHAPFHFDLSILDLYYSIRQGASIVLIDEASAKNPRQLAALIETYQITHWYSTPTVLKLMLRYGQIDRYDHTCLQYVLFAGEVFPVDPLRKLTECWSQARFYNLYGPTETNVCTYHEVIKPIPPGREEPLPIGKICEHLKGRVIDVDDSGTGELCISGSAVTSGYWKNDMANSDKFFASDGFRWYATGDLVTIADNGLYLYTGRKDRMIKKYGFRIEPMEIEACLHRHPLVVDAAVIAREVSPTVYRIEAYWSSRKTEDISQEDMRSFCLKNLPYYMVPDVFRERDIPKTSTDKTDYQSLLREEE